MALQLIDILIYENGDGGDLQLRNEDLQKSQALTNQMYLALYGGNIEENTSLELEEKERRLDYWGNAYLEQEQQFNSNFERALNNTTLNSAGISVLEDAAKEDLSYLSDYANIEVEGNMPKPHRFELNITVEQPDTDSVKVKFIWDSQKKEFYQKKII
jgi:phage gp46-like protein